MENATEMNWYKRICHSCPYFVDAGTKEAGIRCERPNDQECLGNGLLVQVVEIQRGLDQVQELKQKTEAAFPPIKHKKIKRRR